MKKYILSICLISLQLLSFAQTIPQRKIGKQIWMVANLNVSKFRNGDPIPQAKTAEQWTSANENKQPAWCYYKNDPLNGSKYGKLYNWYAVNDPRGLAPKGWHIPSIDEWGELVDSTRKSNNNLKPLKSTTGWKNYETGGYETGEDCVYCGGTGQRYSKISYKYITCTVCGGSGGNKSYSSKRILSGNGTNKSGFTGLPGGFRNYEDAIFYWIGEAGLWWSSEEVDDKNGYAFSLLRNDYNYEKLNKGYGGSVRCLKD